ncbi:hypothetical protein MTO96_014214 [Rhipicephalus appendiculatus]
MHRTTTQAGFALLRRWPQRPLSVLSTKPEDDHIFKMAATVNITAVIIDAWNWKVVRLYISIALDLLAAFALAVAVYFMLRIAIDILLLSLGFAPHGVQPGTPAAAFQAAVAGAPMGLGPAMVNGLTGMVAHGPPAALSAAVLAVLWYFFTLIL